MEAILNYYLEDGHLEPIKNYTNDSLEKERVIYEVIRVINKVPLFYEDHIKRLESSFKLMEKPFSYKYDKIREYLLKLIKANNVEFGNIKLTFDMKTDTMKVFSIKHNYPKEELYRVGVKTILYHGERTNPNAKIIDSNFREKVTNEINKASAFEAILVSNDGYITEGSKSNIFMIKDDKLYTSPLEAVLPGVTRGRIIELSKSLGIKVEEKRINYKDIKSFEAMFISGTSPKILPIFMIDDIELNVNNEILQRLIKEFNKEVDKYVKKFKK
ncbi:aminotransferase class IV [Clostridium sp. AL.422]|uniref:aminotransferase class IV n=1 Tax=Clostridium TaxID=1485 RepID=UPI00293DFA8E|nr:MULTISPECIES: aminotransferase class IV [unclassified Clostridium]MDV4149740.1 aminotransferase class IV [Clostridium sp. AL.422]